MSVQSSSSLLLTFLASLGKYANELSKPQHLEQSLPAMLSTYCPSIQCLAKVGTWTHEWGAIQERTSLWKIISLKSPRVAGEMTFL